MKDRLHVQTHNTPGTVMGYFYYVEYEAEGASLKGEKNKHKKEERSYNRERFLRAPVLVADPSQRLATISAPGIHDTLILKLFHSA